MKGNADKCHFICNSNQKVNLTVENEETTNNICEKLLGIKIYSKIVLKCTRSISVYRNQWFNEWEFPFKAGSWIQTST